MTNELTNEFRNGIETRKGSEQEMMERDQMVTYLRSKLNFEMLEADCEYLMESIDKLKAYGQDIFLLPDCEARTSCLEENKGQIERLEKKIAETKPSRALVVMLNLFEEKFGLQAEANKKAVGKDEPEELQDK